ncbi:unnamed protein product [Ceratitis capitata]|uniref:(Mediterranean fruit fly) hypothetical protein n=1 Tax=Ceratitis capitata TaxID=7213 RepID=A0A811UKN8_CERCA|nr:unnamed protein product [Ceratitis capitata]
MADAVITNDEHCASSRLQPLMGKLQGRAITLLCVHKADQRQARELYEKTNKRIQEKLIAGGAEVSWMDEGAFASENE